IEGREVKTEYGGEEEEQTKVIDATADNE
ncbi:MAG: hypothetical protein JWP88_1190, partial [Flaviaesturariibacter sp.]|nr:hypothetical protein [Flaviaesturariibacter sp.]